MKQIGILVVHGIGEQKWFQTLESITTNFYQALKDRYGSNACRQVLTADGALYLGDEAIWREAPVRLRWRKGSDEHEAVFREVYWADLDEPENGLRFLRFVFWALTVAATRKYDQSTVLRPPGVYGMRPPTALGWLEEIWVRVRLFLVSVFLLMSLLTVGVFHWLLRRLLQISILGRVMRILYDYLGDVKLYQDEYSRTDRIETVGEKSRVVIRRRMITALVKMALDGEIDEYYIIAHSLGTVVAFNGLMETEAALPNYLTQEIWEKAKSGGLTKTLDQPVEPRQMPERPLWLTSVDGINRSGLFDKLRGFLTLGSPLDKFAAVWPRIVPINCQPVPNNVPWHNVADAQDIVGAELDLFGDDRRDCPGGNPTLSFPPPPPIVGGLTLHNHTWADQLSLFSAHTSYWKAEGGRSGRTINRLIDWVEGGTFAKPDQRFPPAIAKSIFILTLLVVGFFLTFFPGALYLLYEDAPIELAAFFSAIPTILSTIPKILCWSIAIILVLTIGRLSCTPAVLKGLRVIWGIFNSVGKLLLILLFLGLSVFIIIRLPGWLIGVLQCLRAMIWFI